MRAVIKRHGTSVNAEGYIIHDETPSSYEEAEGIIGRKLDRRKNYAIIEGQVCESLQWTDSCSGCYESNEGYPPSGTTIDKNGVALGSGCEECGYSGKVLQSMWIPVSESEVRE